MIQTVKITEDNTFVGCIYIEYNTDLNIKEDLPNNYSMQIFNISIDKSIVKYYGDTVANINSFELYIKDQFAFRGNLGQNSFGQYTFAVPLGLRIISKSIRNPNFQLKLGYGYIDPNRGYQFQQVFDTIQLTELCQYQPIGTYNVGSNFNRFHYPILLGDKIFFTGENCSLFLDFDDRMSRVQVFNELSTTLYDLSQNEEIQHLTRIRVSGDTQFPFHNIYVIDVKKDLKQLPCPQSNIDIVSKTSSIHNGRLGYSLLWDTHPFHTNMDVFTYSDNDDMGTNHLYFPYDDPREGLDLIQILARCRFRSGNNVPAGTEADYKGCYNYKTKSLKFSEIYGQKVVDVTVEINRRNESLY